ncbi:DUF4435 domain-containing protein [uncultured Psychrobacter sp.]|uniref:DUF4435 domain-containing protein n=1 Tax=uncultured Psychrobacter sp. TaxID=259303 RepID=UPI00345A3092
MSKVEEMLSELDNSAVLFKKFMNISKSEQYRKNNLIPCIVEGDEDFSFYEPKVRPLLHAKLEKLISGGIDKAVEFVNAINRSNYYSNNCFIVFLDSDFNLDSEKDLKDSRVFYLNKYSVENFFITDDFFCNVLEALTKLEIKRKATNGEIDESSDFVKVRDYIFDERDKLVVLMIDYMVCLRAIVVGNSEIEFKPFKDVLPKLIENSNLIKDNGTVNTSNFKHVFDLDVLSPEEIEYVESRITDSKTYFSANKYLDAYRGKELVFIAYKVLALTKSTFHKKSNMITTKLKFSKQLKEEDFINDFVAYTEEPEGLREFINKLKSNYIFP